MIDLVLRGAKIDEVSEHFLNSIFTHRHPWTINFVGTHTLIMYAKLSPDESSFCQN